MTMQNRKMRISPKPDIEALKNFGRWWEQHLKSKVAEETSQEKKRLKAA